MADDRAATYDVEALSGASIKQRLDELKEHPSRTGHDEDVVHDLSLKSCQLEFARLTKQYQDLQNQFLDTENRYADKVTECIAQQEMLEKVTGQLASHRRSHSAQTDAQDLDSRSKEQILVQVDDLHKLTEKLKRKSAQDTRDMEIMEERICQLEAHTRDLRAELKEQKDLKCSLITTQTELKEARTKNATIEAVLAATQTEVSMLEAMVAEMNYLPDNPPSPAFDTTPGRKGSASSVTSHSTILRRDMHSFESLLARELDEGFVCSSQGDPVSGDNLQAELSSSSIDVDPKSLSLATDLSGMDQTREEDQTLEMQNYWKLHSLLLSKNLELKLQQPCSRTESQRATAILQQISVWRAQEAELDHYRELAKADADALGLHTDLGNLDPDASTLREGDKLEPHPTAQSRTLRLLKKQDAIIRSYRLKFESLQKTQCHAAIRAEQAIKDQKFKMYRRMAEERIARLRLENTLVARAFYDLAARLQQSNLSLQRANAAPRTFLSRARVGVAMTAPQPQPR
ncbi:putative Myosin type II heavy chain [Taphrina deformans PYCC 5710]|uniref:Myosin type II heavy chain n=1 Tax=Taphrina deformans (strain PYCC 5710 / ATCC 11124 / CBS 356.35 / IMI 108563 / JCM 9778 / NBRC 8474) TaxID=1097556 RepID=R4XBK0_TAPDE|nr:putative Myosin type II heavy chain [Taphrina deformans PYCC 5710]|eukprot:CCG83240.1 putative Myosin type II heavy chain [Taphrina deformans PYCC 5710]